MAIYNGVMINMDEVLYIEPYSSNEIRVTFKNNRLLFIEIVKNSTVKEALRLIQVDYENFLCNIKK